MNSTARLILDRLDVRRRLLTSLLSKSSGMYVSQDVETGLYAGEVHGAPALVPIEHARAVDQTVIYSMRQRGLNGYIKAANYVALSEALRSEQEIIAAEYAWVQECG